jgi:hypothetical protein
LLRFCWRAVLARECILMRVVKLKVQAVSTDASPPRLPSGAMKAFVDKIGHRSELGTDFQAASAALADFMYQVHLMSCSHHPCSTDI